MRPFILFRNLTSRHRAMVHKEALTRGLHSMSLPTNCPFPRLNRETGQVTVFSLGTSPLPAARSSGGGSSDSVAAGSGQKRTSKQRLKRQNSSGSYAQIFDERCKNVFVFKSPPSVQEGVD